jgi:iron(III) transport system substrate-binding protein
MMLSKECVVGFFVAALSLLPSGSGLWAASESQLQAANKEGTVSVYGGATLEHMTTLIKNFNRTYPAIEVKYLRKTRTALFELILRELRAKTYNADVYMPIEISEALYLEQRKLLAPYASPERNFVPEKLKDKQGYWTTLYQTGHVFAYNTKLVAPKEIPRTYEDFMHPRWKGKIIMHTDEEFWYASVLEILGKEKGTSLMRGLAQQEPQFQGSKTLMMQLLCAGEVALAVPVNFNQAHDAVKKGCPSDWVVIEPQTQRPPFVIAMAPNAPHPAAAKLFIDFLLSKEPQKFMQENIFRQSGRSDVEPSGDLVKLKGVPTWKSDWDMIFKNAARYRDSYRKIFNLQN